MGYDTRFEGHFILDSVNPPESPLRKRDEFGISTRSMGYGSFHGIGSRPSLRH